MSPSISFTYFRFDMVHPTTEAPSWKDQVSRWSQLDGAAFSLTEFYTRFDKQLARPAMVILASPSASNQTDHRFVSSGSSSPSLFVHTLPNIRCSPLFQVMKWSGEVLCIQKDPETLLCGLREGLTYLRFHAGPVLILGVVSSGSKHSVHGFQMGLDQKGEFEISESELEERTARDDQWLHWLQSQGSEYRASDFVVRRM